MKAFDKIGSFISFLVTIPMYIVTGIAEGWAAAFETHKRRLSVFNLLMYGCPNLGIYKAGLQVVCQRETIWEEDEIFMLNLPSALLRMKVHTWDIRDGKLWIKVCINERLLKELAEAREEKRTKRNIQASAPDVNKLSERKENKMKNENEMKNATREAPGLAEACGCCCDTEKPEGHMDFGEAIRALKEGLKVARAGWNGRGMYLWLKPAAEVKREWCRDPYLIDAIDRNGGESIAALGTICMFTHDSTGRKAVLTGWLASQSDMLCEDWYIVD